jgi:cytoskeletal protein CcmA (bactofilin family)
LPSTLGWLDPSRTQGQLNLLANAASYLIFEGGSMLDFVRDAASALAFNLVLLAGLAALFRRSAGISALLSVIGFMAIFSSPSYAIDIRRTDRNVTVPEGETVDDTLVVFGDSINVDGTVNGDLITFSRSVNIRGTVKGNVIGFGQRLIVDGSVEGSVLGFGQSAQTRGRIGNNLYSFGQEVRVESEAQVAGNVTFFGGEARLDGRVGRDFSAFGGQADIQGDIARNVTFRGGELHVSAPAHVGGNLTARVEENDDVVVDSGARIDGRTDISLREPAPSRYSRLSFYVWRLIWLAAAFLAGLIAFWLMPALASVNLDTGRTLLTAAGVGFLALIATPIAAIIIALTMIGLPVGLVTLALWLTGLYLAKIVIAGFLGRALLAGPGEQQRAPALMLLAGLVLVFIAVNLPYIGGVINLLLTVLGLGALVVTIYRTFNWQTA